jgi:hypothetical protein
MPLRRYRSVEEMPSPIWSAALDPDNLRRAGAVSALAARLHPRRFSVGLHKYRSIEEASRAREGWELHDTAPQPPDIDANGVDRAQIRAMLALTPAGRLKTVQEFVDAAQALRERNGARPVR